MFENIIDFIKDKYKSKDFIPLHEPRFLGNEKKYVNECIDSTFVSSVGVYVDEFEEKIAKYTGAKYAVATSNGTSALHISLLLANVDQSSEVITQPLTFVATCNAINYCGAQPIFLDVDKDTMGLSPNALKSFLEENTSIKNQQCINNISGKVIKACLPMHTFGHPCKIDVIKEICDKNHIFLIEDAAESVGSQYKDKHTGTFGQLGVMSFNGNKIITAGGGGCIVTNDKTLAKKAKHLSTTAKVLHKWDFNHDMVGYNYRMPNLNAALLVAQLENLSNFLERKRILATNYEDFFKNQEYTFFKEPLHSKSNYWLNTLLLKNKKQRNQFLEETNSCGVMTRPIWIMMHKLPMYKDAQCGDLTNSIWLNDRVVNIPSSVVL
jgi:perosamine synthetase|tara:strand:- start:625 stop:1764 length:1140 start_codon:yes stop_codon:yes gene_type:complete